MEIISYLNVNYANSLAEIPIATRPWERKGVGGGGGRYTSVVVLRHLIRLSLETKKSVSPIPPDLVREKQCSGMTY